VNWIDRLTLGRRRGKPNADGAALNLGMSDDPPIVPLRRKASHSLPEPSLPRFHATAADQIDPRWSDENTSLRIRLRSAFTPAQPITEQRMFAGRREILMTLIRSIEDERLHVILYGERGIGKTSLLHVLAQAARDARYIVAYLSCGASSSFDETFRTVAEDIPLMFHRDHGPTSPEAERGDMFTSLLGDAPVSARQASDLCAKVIDTRVLVILDEFDRCENPEFRRDIAEFLKNLSDRSVRVQLVIAGVADNLAELIQHRPTINRNILAVEAPRMSSEEIGELVAKGEAASGLHFEDHAREMVVSVANGMPYSASLLSQHAGLAALAEGRSAVADDDVSAALAEALVEIHGRLTRRAQFQLRALIRDGGHKLLGPVAGIAQFSGGRFSLDDIAHAFSNQDAHDKCRVGVERLAAERSLVEAVTDEFGQHYRFLDESVPAYLWFLTAQANFIGRGAAARTEPEQKVRAGAES
jgi:Cdc6-like AAA superfamily ATPase